MTITRDSDVGAAMVLSGMTAGPAADVLQAAGCWVGEIAGGPPGEWSEAGAAERRFLGYYAPAEA